VGIVNKNCKVCVKNRRGETEEASDKEDDMFLCIWLVLSVTASFIGCLHLQNKGLLVPYVYKLCEAEDFRIAMIRMQSAYICDEGIGGLENAAQHRSSNCELQALRLDR
jgi:hypothetical protein